MRYQSPSLSELLVSIVELRSDYKGKNAQRNNFLKLLTKVAKLISEQDEEAAKHILIGALIYEMEVVEGKYTLNSPVINKGYLYNSGSQLYTNILNKLNINDENKIKDDERLIYLNKFYQFIENKMPNEAIHELNWKNKSALLQGVCSILQSIKHRENERIDLLLHAEPKLIALEKLIPQLYSEYELATSSRWFKSGQRTDIMLFIEFIRKSCDLLYGNQLNKNISEAGEETSDANETQNLRSFVTRMGVMIYALLSIYNEYYIRSPKNSILFKECLAIINAKDLNAIDQTKKVNYLRALSSHFAEVISLTEEKDESDSFYSANNQGSMKIKLRNLKAEFELNGLKRLEEYQIKIDKQLNEQEVMKTKKSRVRGYLGTASGYAAQGALGYAATRSVLPLITTLGVTAAGTVAAPIVMVMFGTSGTMIAMRLVGMAMPNAVSSLYEKIMERIGTVLGVATVELAYKTFSVSSNGIKKLMGFYKEQTNDPFLEDWIETLLTLPDSVISVAEKNQIKGVLGKDDYELKLACSGK